MLKTYQGSCHCGAVKFEADVDLSKSSQRCNCSFCFKNHLWKTFVRGDAVRVTKGISSLTDYRATDSQWPEGHMHHYFCAKCGVRPFSKGFLDQMGGWFHGVNLAALDGLTDAEFAAIPIKFEDGRNDNYEKAPAETRHL